jgi:hypothetical protein
MAVSAAVVLLIGVAAGAVRLLPWLVSPDVPWTLAGPFAEELWHRASETAVLVGLPVGAAIAAALFVESGAARSLMALGASPLRLSLSVAWIGSAFVVAGAALGLARFGGDSPGHFLWRLIDSGRAACEHESQSSRVDVPFVGAAWLCFADTPRFVGRVPGVRADLVFSALRVDETEGSGLDFRDLRVAGKLGVGESPELRFRAAAARVEGLTGFGRAQSRFAAAARGSLVAAIAALAAFAVAWFIVRRSVARPVLAASGAAVVAIVMLWVLREIDRRPSGAALPVASRGDR